jgi:hypothetical protein
MTLSFTLAYASGTTTSSSTRGPMLVSPSTTAIYISLETTAGQGNSTFSYAEPVNATVCPNETCSYSIQMPVGSDLISILTAYTGNLPLDYAGSVPFTVTAAGPNTLTVALSAIVAKAVPSYAFAPFNGSTPSYPLVTPSAAYDAAGDVLPTFGTFPQGGIYSQINVSQTAGTFDTINALDLGQGSYEIAAGPITAGNSTVFPLSEHGGYVVELGDGTTNAFSSTVTFATPLVQFTQTEFPALPVATVSVPASSNAITLTCQFPGSPLAAGGLSSNPCPSAVPVTIGVL